MMNDMFSLDSVVATRRGPFCLTFRGLKPTAKVMRPRRGPRTADLTSCSPPARGGVDAFRGRGGGSVQNKYNNDPGKLAAWLSASHFEKPPKKKSPPTP
jgi:hypothetical protein